MVTPAFGVLQDVYKKVSYSFMIPTIIFVGCLYASVTGRFVFFRMFRDSKHVTEHTVKGWIYWSLVLLASWIASSRPRPRPAPVMTATFPVRSPM